MKLYFCEIEGGNFGDDMNLWFWDAVFPKFRQLRPDYTLFGIGSILSKGFLSGHDRVVVLGSGTGYGPFPKPLPEHMHFGWVRGPMTARNLGLADDCWITDPAALVARMPEFRDEPAAVRRPIFIPHCGTVRQDLPWTRICRDAGLELVSPAAESKGVIRKIAQASLVVTESLHGAIVADALRVPWIPIALSPTFSSYKWEDWGHSMEMRFEIAPALVGMKRALHFGKRALELMRRKPKPVPVSVSQPVQVPKGSLQSSDQEYRLSQSERHRVRKVANLASPIIAYRITRDLVQAARKPPNLSDESVLERRLQQMEERLHVVERTLPDLS